MLNALKTLPAAIPAKTGLLAKGKSLVLFYKSGITNIWYNRKESQQLRKRLGVLNSLDLSKKISENAHLISIESMQNAKTVERMIDVSRSEFLTLARTEQDIRKLPLFALVFGVCFELTPLVLFFCPQLSPSTCYSPSYISKIRKKYSVNLENLKNMAANLDGSESVFKLDDAKLKQLAYTLNLTKFPLPRKVLQTRIQNHLIRVRADDYFLKRDISKLRDLDPEELKRALMARCLPLDNGVENLEKWLKEFKEPMDAGYMYIV